ncbi:DUF4238 domain-containing protein [Rhizobium sp. CG4]|nr:DUF4238 domain-containing protein [Rhizobium sp. CG4]
MVDFSAPLKLEKPNQHFVPRFWQKHFRSNTGGLFKTERGSVVRASVGDTMTSDWTYIVFDEGWRASDDVEDQLSKWESEASRLIKAVLPFGTPLAEDDWRSLCRWLGIATSRHPNVMIDTAPSPLLSQPSWLPSTPIPI